MRRTFLTLFAAAMVATPAFADWGTITLDIKAWDGDSWEDALCVPTCDPMSVPIQVWASATTGGSEGLNNGVQALYFNIVGSCLDGVMQQSMQLDSELIKMYFPAFAYYGLGFDQLISPGPGGISGTGAVGQIAGIGAAQQPPTGPGSMDMPGALTANAAHANGTPPVLIATGTVFTNGLCTEPCGSGICPPEYVLGCSIDTEGNGAFWKPDTNAGDSIIVDDQLWICTVPEPSTLILLVPALLGLRRRR